MTFKKDSKDDAFKKPMFELIEPAFIESIAKILTTGAKKYGVDNYKKANKKERSHYIGALHRHFNKFQQGELLDPDTGESHLSSVAVNAMFLYYFYILKRGNKQ